MADKLVITGGKSLFGRVRVSGRKNAAVAVIPAVLLGREPSTIENLPPISDVLTYQDILVSMGCKIDVDRNGQVTIDPSVVRGYPPYEPAKKLRASSYLMGALLAKYGEAEVPLPGGCEIGSRPIDQHLKGFKALGAEVEIKSGVVRLKARKLVGAPVYLDVVSVGATINIMLAASLAEGTTVIENAAKEPHIVDVANCLNSMGADIRGAGTDTIKIRGVSEMHGTTHAIIPDEIEAATYMIAAAGTRGEVVVENVIPKHLEPISAKLKETGAEVSENGEWIRVVGCGRPKAVNIKTLPYPGFPTDAQQPITPLLAIAEGTSFVTETIWESRFRHVEELKRMGTSIKVEGRTAIIEGVDHLTGAPVNATDLRGGAAMVVAGLIAEGTTEVTGVEHIDRGYEAIEEKLNRLGADIFRRHESEASARAVY